jgi:hypothetical protein
MSEVVLLLPNVDHLQQVEYYVRGYTCQLKKVIWQIECLLFKHISSILNGDVYHIVSVGIFTTDHHRTPPTSRPKIVNLQQMLCIFA